MKNKNFKVVWFYDEVYKQNILFCIGDAEQTIKYIKESYNIKVTISHEKNAGKCWEIPSYGIIIWLDKFSKTPKNIAILAHECLHASLFILNDKIDYTSSHSEALNYHVEFIIRKFLEEY